MKKIFAILLALWLIPICSFGDSFESWNIGLGNDDVIGIAMVSDTDGWALLLSMNMYHWDGQEWKHIPFPGPAGSADGKGSPYGLEYYDPTHIYDFWVGLHMYDGTSWIEFEPPPPFGIDDLKVINPNSIWGCGNNYDTCYWNGTEWTVYPDTPGFGADYVQCIGFGSAEEGWAGGTMGAMAHFYDGAWHAYGPITSGWLKNADFANNTYGIMDGPHVSLMYYQGSWEGGDGLPNIFTDCYAINDEYFAEVAEYPQSIYLFHNNTVFKGHDAGAPLYCVFATSPHSIWAGGENGYVCHWTWSDEDVQPTSVGEIKAQFPPQTDLSPNKMLPQTQNDCDPLCPQLEFEK